MRCSQRAATMGSDQRKPACCGENPTQPQITNEIKIYEKVKHTSYNFTPLNTFFFFFGIFMICVTITTVYFRTFFPSKIPFFNQPLSPHFVSLVAQKVKNLPAIRETSVRSLDWEDPLEKGLATLSSILACRIPWTEEPGGLQSLGSQRVGHDWVTNTFTFHGD